MNDDTIGLTEEQIHLKVKAFMMDMRKLCSKHNVIICAPDEHGLYTSDDYLANDESVVIGSFDLFTADNWDCPFAELSLSDISMMMDE